MDFTNSTRGRRDGTNQYDRREMKRKRLIAVINDEKEVDVLSLLEYEELRKSGTVARFRIIEVEQ